MAFRQQFRTVLCRNERGASQSIADFRHRFDVLISRFTSNARPHVYKVSTLLTLHRCRSSRCCQSANLHLSRLVVTAL